MSDTAMVPRKPADGDRPSRRPLVDEQLADQLLGKAQAEGVELLGPDGLLSQVTKAVLERALAEEMTGHLGYDKHDPAGRGSGNNRNGTTGKTVLTDIGAVGLAVPRDRNGSFEPQIVRKGQTRLDGFNERIIALYARGMTTRDIRAHLREIYDVDVSPDLISRVTDAVVEELAEWQSRPLDGGLRRRDPPGDLHHQCHRVAERPLPAGGQGPRPLPHRAGGAKVPLPGHPLPRPDRPGTGPVGDAMETGPERFRHHLRRPVPGRRDLLTQPPETPLARQTPPRHGT
jgi:Transposase, Mutator family